METSQVLDFLFEKCYSGTEIDIIVNSQLKTNIMNTNLQSIFKGGVYVIATLLLANLVESLIPIPPKYNPFVSIEWTTLLWHSAVAILIAAFTGVLTGLLAQFFYMLDDGQFDPDEKKKAYAYAYMAFFISIGILLAANLFGENAFQTAMIFNGSVDVIMLFLVFISKAFGKGIDQGGTAGIGLNQHTNQAPPQPQNQTAAQQGANQNAGSDTKIHPFAIALIALFAIAILVRVCFPGSVDQHPNKKDPPTEQTDKGGNDNNQKTSDQNQNQSTDGNGQQANPQQHVVWDAATEQAKEDKADNDFINGPPSYQGDDWNQKSHHGSH